MSETFHELDADRTGVAGIEVAVHAPTAAHEGSLDEAGPPAVTPLRRAVRRFLRSKAGVAGFAYLLLMVLVALLGRWIRPHDPNAQEFRPFLGPSSAHWLGTDDLGRDVASRLMVGTAVSVRAAYQTVAMALVIAVPIGLVAGYLGGKVDNVLMRIMDAMNSFPALVLALVIAAVLGPGLGNAMIAISVVLIPGFVRLTRASTLAVSQETFVEASRSIGTSTPTILRKRILPSVLSPLIVALTLVLGVALIAEASLSFLGLGTQPPDASWGNMLSRGYTFIYSEPFLMVPPGVAIALAVLSFNIVGDALRDALGLAESSAPRGRRGRIGLTLGPPPPGRSRKEGAAPAAQQAHSGAPAAATTAGVHGATAVQPVQPLLAVRDLQIEFAGRSGPITVVDGVSFDVQPGEVVGLVGESGSGKTVTALSIMRLLPSPPARVVGGEVRFDGRDLLTLPFRELSKLRGNDLAMVFQDPMASLNPAFTIGNQLIEAVRLHQDVSRAQARSRALELLELVGIPDPPSRMKEYPHRLSGGMRQRVLIAMALVNEPKLLIADEPTTALDVTVQAQILDLLRTLQRDLGMAMIFVTHDLGVIADIADRVVVMYAGQLVEQSPVDRLFAAPRHPYTRKLLAAMPQATDQGARLASIPGLVPIPGYWADGCRFSPRCDHADAACHAAPVPLIAVDGPDQAVRCVHHAELSAAVDVQVRVRS